MTEWATLVLFILIGTRLPSLMMALLSYLLRPSLLLQPVFDVIQPLRQRLENAYRDVLRNGSFVQHLSGLFNLGRSLAEFTTIPFQVATLAPVRYVRYLLQFFCGSTAYVIYVGALAAITMTLLNLPFPREEVEVNGVTTAVVTTVFNEVRSTMEAASEFIQRIFALNSIEGFLLVMYGHSCFAVAMLGLLATFHASYLSMISVLVWFILGLAVDSADNSLLNCFFFIGVILIPVGLGLRFALVDLREAMHTMLPLSATVATVLTVNVLSDMHLVALLNGFQIILAAAGKPFLRILLPGSATNDAVGRSLALAVADVCYHVQCGDLMTMPQRQLGDIRPHLGAPPGGALCLEVQESCLGLADNAINLTAFRLEW